MRIERDWIEILMQIRNSMVHRDLGPVKKRFDEENVKRKLPEKGRLNQD